MFTPAFVDGFLGTSHLLPLSEGGTRFAGVSANSTDKHRPNGPSANNELTIKPNHPIGAHSEGIMTTSPVAYVTGPRLRLRLITPEDAPYVHALRIDPLYSRHLSPVTGTAEDQRRWIDLYKAEEARCQQLYYVIERHDGTRCGVVRLYGIGDEEFTWGSWILDANKPPKAALESALLSFGIGFDHLGLKVAKVDVRAKNTHAEAFYRRLGMIETHRTAQDIFFDYPRKLFEEARSTYLQLLKV